MQLSSWLQRREVFYSIMPIPSVTSKIYGPCSNSFNCVQYLLNRINFFRPWSKVISYLITLSMVKKFLVQPNFFLNYGWTDGLGINIFFSFSDCIEDQHWTNYTLFNFKYVWIFLHHERIHRRIPMLYPDSYEVWNHWHGLCSILLFGYVSLHDLPSW